MSHSKSRNSKLHLGAVFDVFVDSLMTPIYTLVGDTSLGLHDTNFPASPTGETELERILERNGYNGDSSRAPLLGPLNLFFEVICDQNGLVSNALAVGNAGDAVTLRAEVDCFFVVAACQPPLILTPGQEARTGSTGSRHDSSGGGVSSAALAAVPAFTRGVGYSVLPPMSNMPR